MMNVSVRKAISSASRRAVGTRREFSAMVSPAIEYPDVPDTIPVEAKAGSASVSTLSNGLTIVTEDACTTSTVSLTFPKAGSGSEAADEHGAALVNKCMAFRSGSFGETALTSLLIMRNLEDDGATPFATVNRQTATVGYTAAPDKVARLIPLLALNSAFVNYDIAEAKDEANYESLAANASAQVVLTEQVYAAAYGAQSSMGRPLFFPTPSVDAVVSFRNKAYGLNGAVLAATGVKDHEAFVTTAEDALSEALVGSGDAGPAPVYVGGEGRVAATSGYAHVALAFASPALTPLRSVVKQCISLAGGESGLSGFETSGLIGVYAGGPAGESAASVDAMTKLLTSAPSADIVKRAKSLAKAEAVFASDTSKPLAAAMTTSVLETGTFASLGSQYDAITEKDVADAISAMLKTSPSVAAVGDITDVPYHSTIASRFS